MSYQLVSNIVNELRFFKRLRKKVPVLTQPKFDQDQIAEIRNRIIHMRQQIELMKKNRQNPQLIRLKKIELSQARSRLRMMLKNEAKPTASIVQPPVS